MKKNERKREKTRIIGKHEETDKENFIKNCV